MRPLLTLSSPSLSSKIGQHPDPDRPRRLPQVPPSGLRGKRADGRLRRSPPWCPPAPPGLGTAPGVRGWGGASRPSSLSPHPAAASAPSAAWSQSVVAWTGAGREGRGKGRYIAYTGLVTRTRPGTGPPRPAPYGRAAPLLAPLIGLLPSQWAAASRACYHSPTQRQGQEPAVRRPRSPGSSETFPLKVNVFGIGPARQAPTRWLANRAAEGAERGRRRRSAGLPGGRSDGGGRKIWEIAQQPADNPEPIGCSPWANISFLPLAPSLTPRILWSHLESDRLGPAYGAWGSSYGVRCCWESPFPGGRELFSVLGPTLRWGWRHLGANGTPEQSLLWPVPDRPFTSAVPFGDVISQGFVPRQC